MSSLALVVLVSLLNQFVFAQTTHPVHIGLEGSFYDPPALIATKGDIVVFSFDGLLHGVTQSSFDNPCVPLPGGFNSGLYGNGANSTAPVPVWALHITDDTQPIYYFCQGTVPASHCSRGMAGAINPPSNDVFEQYLSKAKAVTGTPTPSIGVTLSGIGAFATNTPTPTTTIVPTTTAAPPVPSTSSSSSTPTPTQPVQALSHVNEGAVVGGAVGGTIAAVLFCLIVLFFIWNRRQKNIPPSAQYLRDPYEKSHGAHRAGYAEYGPQVPYQNYPQDGRRLGDLDPNAGPPVRAPSLRSDTVDQHQNVGASFSDNRLTQFSDTRQDLAGVASSSNLPVRQSAYEIREIAKEVAEILKQQPPPAPQQDIASPQPNRELPNSPDVDQISRSATSSRPPQYRG
ncbi:hypothetical protein BD410DRAFT_635540 [Rickenella mellea]|uniref:Cupredoxin n=1 Tax=Rickenella mellea TaxID=50990 RepID=A0A4Y7QD99_9AGAM|nr:hypothetical protein BD410DRAFT_635540 [Rickenella mellea]